MRTYAFILILIAIAASRRSRNVLLREQPHHWLSAIMAFIARTLGA
jgi:hypothetical protein